MTHASTPCLRLTRSQTGSHARMIGLHEGDLLVSVDGLPLSGPPAALIRRLSRMAGNRTLGIVRGGIRMAVTGDLRRLGPWEAAPALPGEDIAPADGTRRWQVLEDADGVCDLVSLDPDLLAAVAPPFWLAGARAWTGLAAFATALALALPFGTLAVAGLWLISGAHLWRHGPAMVLQARIAAGMRATAVITAATETGAQAVWRQLSPGARFRFGPASEQDPVPKSA